MRNDSWRKVAAAQLGLMTRSQLAACGVARSTTRRRIASGDWMPASSSVVSTSGGPLSHEQMLQLGVLHAGSGSAVGELTAAAAWGLRRWERDEVTIVVPHTRVALSPVPGIVFRRSRRDLRPQIRRRRGLPTIQIEPAVLTWAARQASPRAAEAVLAASVQQRLTTAASLLDWVDRLAPLRQTTRFRVALKEIESGAQSVGELDIRRLCKRFGLAPPRRQVRRRDAHGRLRYTDCEWVLPDGRILVLEIDGGFHMDVEQWEDDLARQRTLTTPDRIVVHCTTRELRDQPERVAADLRLLGVPAA